MKAPQITMKLSEYIDRPDLPVPNDVWNKIYMYHAYPMNFIRHDIGSAVYPSSGYRPDIHEYEMQRNGLSTHTFKERPERSDPGRGAADYNVHTVSWLKFIKLMINKSPYNRLILYPEARTPFVHGDYRFMSLRKFYYIMRGSSITEVTADQLIAVVKNEIIKSG